MGNINNRPNNFGPFPDVPNNSAGLERLKAWNHPGVGHGGRGLVVGSDYRVILRPDNMMQVVPISQVFQSPVSAPARAPSPSPDEGPGLEAILSSIPFFQPPSLNTGPGFAELLEAVLLGNQNTPPAPTQVPAAPSATPSSQLVAAELGSLTGTGKQKTNTQTNIFTTPVSRNTKNAKSSPDDSLIRLLGLETLGGQQQKLGA